MDSRGIIRRLAPFWLRVELLRLRRWPRWFIETSMIARTYVEPSHRTDYCIALAERSSPLRRRRTAADPVLQRGKERNVALAADKIDGVLVRPGEVFSYHQLVGRPCRWRGFVPGLELRDGETAAGVGGGCCQLSNLLYLLALEAGMKIVERHRHGLDLFPDHERTVPFGCGATVFYNYADLRFENPLPQPVLVHARVVDGRLHAEICAPEPVDWSVEVYETDHGFHREGDGWISENRIRRRFTLADGTVLLDQEVARNRGRVQYDPRDSPQ